MSWLPGVNVTSTQPELILRLEERRTRPGYTPFEAMCLSQRVGLEVLTSQFFVPDRYLVYHERPDNSRLNRLHLATREELLAFLCDRIRPARGEGVDLTITAFGMHEFLITNHDGDLWLRRPSGWPPSGE